MKRALIITSLAFILVFAMGSLALAASPQDIYNDYAAHNTFTGPYTVAELNAFLNDATLSQYADQAVLAAARGLAEKVVALMGQGKTFQDALQVAQSGSGQSGEQTGRTTFPWTGWDVFAMIAGSVVLAGSGFVLRKKTR